MLRTLVAAMFCGLALICVATSPVSAENFRMETDVSKVGEKNPECRTLTLFTSGQVYDFVRVYRDKADKQGEDVEVIIYSFGSGRVVLMDLKRSVKTTLSTDQLLQLTASIKTMARPEDKLFYEAAHPNMDVKYMEIGDELTMTSSTLIYAVKATKPELKSAATQYQEYADWSARLSACRPGSLPPFARLEVNSQLAERGLLPQQITRTTIEPGQFTNRKTGLTSVHHVNWTLSTTDRKKIEKVGEQLVTFPEISFKQYVEGNAVADNKK